MKLVSRASRLGYLLASFASYAMGCALHRDFTLDNMIIRAVLDAQVNLTLSHYNECDRLYDIFQSFWRQAAVLPQKPFFT